MILDQISEAYIDMLNEVSAKTPFEVGEHHGEYKKGVAAGNARRSTIGKQENNIGLSQ